MDPETPADEDEPEARADWLSRIAYFMKPRPAGRIELVHSGADFRLRELVLGLIAVAPDLRVLARAPALLEAGSLYRAVLEDGRSPVGDRLAALRGLAACARASGDLPGARRSAEEATRLADPMGDEAMWNALSDLVDVCLAQGDLAAAGVASERLLRAANRLGEGRPLVAAHELAARVAEALGGLEGARAHRVQAASVQAR